ncbi:hypothetical protein RhiJN_16359 [Ceratobasidium sp. AG-Ba]|nr:hypothetical protein RhiJN_16359 [Ceratobasidium sp. AG-Ba]
MIANTVTYDAMFEANINCTLNNTVEMLATAPPLITLRSDSEASIQKDFDLEVIRKQTKSTYMGPGIARMLVAFGLDFINGFFGGLIRQGILTYYSGFETIPNGTFSYYSGTITWPDGIKQTPKITEVLENYTISVAVFENFATALWSAVLSDLGIASPPNAFVHTDLFHLETLLSENSG